MTETPAALLKTHPHLKGFADMILEPIAALAQVRTLAPGEPVFQAGMANEGVYFVISGELRVFLVNAHGEQAFGVLGAGETLGDLALLAPQKHEANVTAETRAVLVFLPLTAIERLRKEKPGVIAQLTARTGQRFALAARGLRVDTLFA